MLLQIGARYYYLTHLVISKEFTIQMNRINVRNSVFARLKQCVFLFVTKYSHYLNKVFLLLKTECLKYQNKVFYQFKTKCSKAWNKVFNDLIRVVTTVKP